MVGINLVFTGDLLVSQSATVYKLSCVINKKVQTKYNKLSKRVEQSVYLQRYGKGLGKPAKNMPRMRLASCRAIISYPRPTEVRSREDTGI